MRNQGGGGVGGGGNWTIIVLSRIFNLQTATYLTQASSDSDFHQIIDRLRNLLQFDLFHIC